jgi:uncharacterized protein (DUF983 family)
MASDSPSALKAGFYGACPRCGKRTLFLGLLGIQPACSACSLSFAGQDSGDGATFFALVIVGFLMVGGAGLLELRFSPPLWVHAVIWVPFTLLGCILCIRFFKAWLIAKQYRHNPESFLP